MSRGLEMMWEPSRQCEDDMEMTGMAWGPQGQWGQHGVEITETMETTAMGTTWGPSGGYGDNVQTTGMMWG